MLVVMVLGGLLGRAGVSGRGRAASRACISSRGHQRGGGQGGHDGQNGKSTLHMNRSPVVELRTPDGALHKLLPIEKIREVKNL